ncbi:MAG TPA: peptidoglycan DD-metalloendopeptidase family protein [Chitinophagaceae bacterium]|nr:peptidoglycan DD-metalloendopeptidase family protein [Chitinophagaceae bacterium]
MSDLRSVLSSHSSDFHSVVPFVPGSDKIILLDFTAANKELTGEIINDIDRFNGYIRLLLESKGALYGIGGYGEHRTVYARSRVFDAKDGEEPRRLHLGLDIWGKAGTAVYAPLDGAVHSLAFNDHYGDYGATIILSHSYRGHSFHTLYGHVSLADLTLEEGTKISRGGVFAHFGEPQENGHWPPHLHFQMISNIGEAKGDYPGVCRYSEREQYLSNCPDPDLLAGLYRFVSI